MSASANVEVNINDCDDADPKKLAAFEAHVASGGLVEAGDWMPEAYRTLMLRMAEHHANSEIVGALPEGEWITRAPNIKRKNLDHSRV